MIPEKIRKTGYWESISRRDYLYLLGGNKAIYRFDEKGKCLSCLLQKHKSKKYKMAKLILGITSSPDGATWFCNTDGDVFRITNSGINKIALPRMFSKVEYVNGILYLLSAKTLYTHTGIMNLFMLTPIAEGTPFSWPSAEVVSKAGFGLAITCG